MAEWLKAAVLKTVKGESSSRVRIPLPPQWFLFFTEAKTPSRAFLLYDFSSKSSGNVDSKSTSFIVPIVCLSVKYGY
jgi:hypothetical protein